MLILQLAMLGTHDVSGRYIRSPKSHLKQAERVLESQTARVHLEESELLLNQPFLNLFFLGDQPWIEVSDRNFQVKTGNCLTFLGPTGTHPQGRGVREVFTDWLVFGRFGGGSGTTTSDKFGRM